MNLRKSHSFRPSLEALEERRVLTTASLTGGLLTVTGTTSDDLIIIKRVFARIHVTGAGSFKTVNVNQISVDGLGGNDRIEVRPTVPRRIDSTIHGGTGADTLFGGTGADFINGDDGDDIIRGGAGNDTIIGEIGNDTLRGDSGNDLMRGGDPGAGVDPTGEDLLNGGPGADTMFGGPADDTLNGSYGRDSLDGVTGNDLLQGGFGNDFLDGGADTDTLNGGLGVDTGVNGEVNSHIP